METKHQENVSFEEAMEIAGYGKFSMYIILLSALTVCCSLLSSLDVSFLLPAAECDFNLSSEDKGLLGTAYFIGIMSASHLSGYLADTMGRQYVLVRGISLNVITYVLGSLAPNFWTFFTLKVISGILTCPCLIATMPFLGEYVPAKRRNQALLVTTALGASALLYSSMIGWAVLRHHWVLDLGFVQFTPWRLFYALCGVPSLICAVLFMLTPESPKFLLTRGKKGDTMKVLQRVHSVNSGMLPQTFPVGSVTVDAGEHMPAVRQKGALGVLRQIVDQTMPLLRPPYVKDLFMCIIMISITFLCVNGVFLWLPELTNRIALYKQTNSGRFTLCEMVKSGGASEAPSCPNTINPAVFVPNLIIAVVQPTVMITTSVLIRWLDRRLIITAVMVGCSVMSAIVIWIPNSSIIIMLIGCIPIFIGLTYNLVTTMLIELFPTYIRAMAVSLTMICGRAGSIIGSYMFSQLIDAHCPLLFNLLAGLLLGCAVVPFCIKLKPKPAQTNVKEVKVTQERSAVV